MATESITFLLKAEDHASSKVKAFSDDTVKRFKDVGAQTKASTELAGTLANTLGGTQFSGAAGQLAQLTERMSAFAEVSKSGGAGALAFKAGAVAAVAVVGFQLGRALSDAIRGVENFEAQLEKLKESASETANMFTSRVLPSLERTAEIARLTGQSFDFGEAINREVQSAEASVQRLEKGIEELQGVNFLLKSDEEKKRQAAMESELEVAKQLVSTLKQRRENYRDVNSEEQKRLEFLQEQAKREDERNKKARDFIKNLEDEVASQQLSKEAMREVEIGAVARNEKEVEYIKYLMDQKDALQEQAKLEKQREQEALAAAKQLAAEKQRIANVEKSAVENLTKQVIALNDGKAAAEAYGLRLQGLDSNVASSIAQAQSLIDEANKVGSSKFEVAPELQAQESRTLSGRGSSVDKEEILARQQEKRDKDRDALLMKAASILESIERKIDTPAIAGPV